MDRTALTLAAVCALTTGALAAQQALARFEVASIKPTQNGIIVGDGAARIGWDAGGRYRMVDGSVGVLLRGAYPGVVEIVGLPGWATSQHYDVEAKAEREPTQTERQALLRQLVSDRFKAVARVEQEVLIVERIELPTPDSSAAEWIANHEALHQTGRRA